MCDEALCEAAAWSCAGSWVAHGAPATFSSLRSRMCAAERDTSPTFIAVDIATRLWSRYWLCRISFGDSSRRCLSLGALRRPNANDSLVTFRPSDVCRDCSNDPSFGSCRSTLAMGPASCRRSAAFSDEPRRSDDGTSLNRSSQRVFARPPDYTRAQVGAQRPEAACLTVAARTPRSVPRRSALHVMAATIATS